MLNTQNISVIKATPSQIGWVNHQYEKIGFATSTFDNEYIAIAQKAGVKCGLGRITYIDQYNIELGGIYVFENFRKMGVADQIVKHLLERLDQNKTVWCLPFYHLLNFYEGFGFEDQKKHNYKIPEKILSKYEWCNKTYQKEVLLLAKNK